MKLFSGAAIVLALALPGAAAGGAIVATTGDVTGAIGGPDARGPEAPPSFDIIRNCAAAFASKEAAGECIAREKLARSKVEDKWPSLSDSVKRTCIARIPRGIARAYFSLEDCAIKEGRLDLFRSTDAGH